MFTGIISHFLKRGLSVALALVILLSVCACTRGAAEEQRVTISGRALWGQEPVAGAVVELRRGAWADPEASERVAQVVTDARGQYKLSISDQLDDLALVALWPDGSVNSAPVTPLPVEPAGKVTADVQLAQLLDWLGPTADATVCHTPTLRWAGVPQAAMYRLWIMDAGTTELVFDLTMTENVPDEQQVTLPPLTPGRSYNWDVLALTSDANLLARHTGVFEVGMNTDCAAWNAPAGVLVHVGLADPARPLEEAVADYLAAFVSTEATIHYTTLDLAGQTALLIEPLPGSGRSCSLFMVRDGQLWRLMLSAPTLGCKQDVADLAARWDAVATNFGIGLSNQATPTGSGGKLLAAVWTG